MALIPGILDDGWHDNLSSLFELQAIAGLTNEQAAALCGVTLRSYQRWKQTQRAPGYAYRLLAVMAGFLPWRGFENWYFCPHDGRLYRRDLRDGFHPSELFEFLFSRQAATLGIASNSDILAHLFRYKINPRADGDARGAARPSGRLSVRPSDASSRASGRHRVGLSGRKGSRLRWRPHWQPGGKVWPRTTTAERIQSARPARAATPYPSQPWHVRPSQQRNPFIHYA